MNPQRSPRPTRALFLLSLAVPLFLVLLYLMMYKLPFIQQMSWLHFVFPSSVTVQAAADLGWYPPLQTALNNLTAVLSGEGVYGFIFNSSETPEERYGTYNWCNMPHVRTKEYVKPEWAELVYVEVVRSKARPGIESRASA